MSNILFFPIQKSVATLPFHPQSSRPVQANPLYKRKKTLPAGASQISPTTNLILLMVDNKNDASRAALRVQQSLQLHPAISQDNLVLLEEIAQEMKLYSARNFLRDYRLRTENDSGG